MSTFQHQQRQVGGHSDYLFTKFLGINTDESFTILFSETKVYDKWVKLIANALNESEPKSENEFSSIIDKSVVYQVREDLNSNPSDKVFLIELFETYYSLLEKLDAFLTLDKSTENIQRLIHTWGIVLYILNMICYEFDILIILLENYKKLSSSPIQCSRLVKKVIGIAEIVPTIHHKLLDRTGSNALSAIDFTFLGRNLGRFARNFYGCWLADRLLEFLHDNKDSNLSNHNEISKISDSEHLLEQNSTLQLFINKFIQSGYSDIISFMLLCHYIKYATEPHNIISSYKNPIDSFLKYVFTPSLTNSQKILRSIFKILACGLGLSGDLKSENGEIDTQTTDNLRMGVIYQFFCMIQHLLSYQTIKHFHVIIRESFDVNSKDLIQIPLALIIIDILSFVDPFTGENQIQVHLIGQDFAENEIIIRLDTFKQIFESLVDQWSNLKYLDKIQISDHCFLCSTISRCLRNANIFNTHMLKAKPFLQQQTSITFPTNLRFLESNLEALLEGLHRRMESPIYEISIISQQLAESIILCTKSQLIDQNLEEHHIEDPSETYKFEQLHQELKVISTKLWYLLPSLKPFQRILCETQYKTDTIEFLTKKNNIYDIFYLYISVESSFFLSDVNFSDHFKLLMESFKYNYPPSKLLGTFSNSIFPSKINPGNMFERSITNNVNLSKSNKSIDSLTSHPSCIANLKLDENYSEYPINIQQCFDRISGFISYPEKGSMFDEFSDPSKIPSNKETPTQTEHRLAIAISTLPNLLEYGSPETENLAIPLFNLLVYLEDSLIENQQRMQNIAMVKLVSKYPIKIMADFPMLFMKPDLNISQKLLLLKIVQDATRDISGNSIYSEKFPLAKQPKTGKKIEHKIIKYNSSSISSTSEPPSNTSQATRIYHTLNGFSDISFLFFNQIRKVLENFKDSNSSDNENIFSKSQGKFMNTTLKMKEPLIFGSLIHTLAIIIECAGQADHNLSDMLSVSLDILAFYISRPNPSSNFQIRCLISLAARLSISHNFLQPIKFSKQFQMLVEWLIDLNQNSPDEIIRKLSSIVIQDLTY